MRFVVALALLISIDCGNRLQSLDSEYQQASSLLRTEHYEAAQQKTDDALRRLEHGGNIKDLWRFRLLRADVLIGQRLSAKALAYATQLGEPPAGAEWHEARAHILLLRGRASSELNRLDEADELLVRAATVAREAGSQYFATEAELRQGRVLIQRGKFEEARTVFREVAETAAKAHDSYQEATARGNIGFALLTESRNDEAIPWFERAIELFTQAGAEESVARAHGNLGNCYFRLGDYDNARLHYDRAQEQFAKTGSRENQQIWIGNAGNVAYETRDFRTAANAYQRALSIANAVPSPVWAARWTNNLAETSLELGDWDAAESYSKDALARMRALKDSGWEPTSVVTAARIEEGRGHTEGARELFRSALTMRAEDPSVALSSHAGLARTWVREGKTKDAEAEFQNTVALIEQRRAGLLKDDYKLPYLGSLIRFYQDYVDFLVANRQPERALEIAESSRSRVLESRAGNQPADTSRHTASDYRRLAQEIHSTVLEYWLGPSHSYLWVITGEEIRLHELPARQDIRRLIESYRAVVAAVRNPLDVAEDTGRRLYEMLLSPAREPSGRFVMVPDQDLYSIDLGSLPAPGSERKFWIEQATVSIAPSLNFLVGRSGSVSPSAKGLLVMGDAPGAGAQYPRLEFAAQEIGSIAQSMDPARQRILRGAQANPAAYPEAGPGQFGFIHFAAHAAANPQSPLDSAIILAGPPDANRLLARSVMEIPLTAELVTISACRSAGGKAYAGEGLVGFAWAFLRAGARNVIAGLWDVGDRSTAMLMASLYANVAAGQDIPTALREAKLELIHKGGAYAKPFYWAPFQLYVGAAR